MVFRMFGFKGVLVVAALGGVLWAAGLNPLGLLDGGGSRTLSSAPASAEEQELANFVGVVLSDTERIWQEQFREAGRAV
jgi:predicted metalloprotease